MAKGQTLLRKLWGERSRCTGDGVPALGMLSARTAAPSLQDGLSWGLECGPYTLIWAKLSKDTTISVWARGERCQPRHRGIAGGIGTSGVFTPLTQ